MIELKLLETNPELVKASLKKRSFKNPEILDDLLNLSKEKKALQQKTEDLKATRNKTSKELGFKKKAGEDISQASKEMKELSAEIKKLDEILRELVNSQMDILLSIPNLLDEKVPEGLTEDDNIVLNEIGEKRNFDFKPLPHYELLEKANLIDFNGGVKLAGSKFYIYKGLLAKLERAILNFMLDTQSNNGYTEMFVPMLANEDSMRGTGQFPKFKDEYYTLEKDGLSLIPTAEVPLTNYHRDEILSKDDLPIRITASTSCFRREAGAAGKETRGLIRVHQFQKVELVSLCRPEDSTDEHKKLLADAESILQLLKIPYRVMLLCSGDTSASSSITYDLEAWMPGLNRYVEISSVSNFRDYQSRRLKIRYKENPKAKASLVHTLNGSGLAAGRTVAAVVENYQNEDGSFTIPEVLKPYMI